jgi:pteridine reductase
MRLQDKVALVTGSAKRVGRAIAEALAAAGADVAIHFGRSADAAGETAEHIRQTTGRRAEVFQADLTQPDEIKRLFRQVGEAFGRLDVLVNNAGVYHRTPLRELTAEQWDAEMAVNARAQALCIRCALPLMADGGAIVNIADIAAEKGWGGYPAYCASKAAVIALTKSAAKALAGRGIRVNSVSPGVVMWADEQHDEDHDVVLAQVPLGRAGSAADVAAAVMFLIGNDYVTAQNLRVDGGWHTS